MVAGIGKNECAFQLDREVPVMPVNWDSICYLGHTPAPMECVF